MNYTDTDVRDWVGATTYSRAVALAPKVLDVGWDEAARPGDGIAYGKVEGARVYDVNLYYLRGKLSAVCTCAEQRNCLHGAALALAVKRQRAVEAAAARTWEERLAAWTAPTPAEAPAAEARTEFVYRLRWPVGPGGAPELQVQVRAAASAQALGWHLYRVDARGPEVDGLVESTIRRLRARDPQYRDGESRTAVSWLVVPPEAFDELLPRLALHGGVEDERKRRLAIHATGALQASLAYEAGPNGLVLRPVLNGPHGPVDRPQAVLLGPPGRRWAAAGGALCRVEPAAEAVWDDVTPIRVPAAERAAFEQRWLPALATRVAGAPKAEWVLGTPAPQLLLEEVGVQLHLRPGFVYGGERVEAGGKPDPEALVGSDGEVRYRRDLPAEARWLKELRAVLPTDALAGDEALGFLAAHAAALTAAGWAIVGRERLRYYRLATVTPAARLSITRGADWFDVRSEVVVAGEPVAWPALVEALQSGQRYVRLGDGDWAPLPEEWFKTRQRLRDRLGALTPEEDGAVRVACYDTPLLAAVLDGTEDAQVDEGWRTFRARLESFGGIAPQPVPAGFVGTLRPYQQQGLDYMAFLRDHGLHGILADDMGLGKTVQAAALLASNPAGPSLIVAPTSVVANWAAELARFVPGLKVLVLHGPKRDLAAIAHHDVVITSYATARLDLPAHRRHTYHTILLDEAQAIKNARSQTARAVRKLQGLHRLCLTGTPLENDTLDLWSLFAFLMPGFLGKLDDFRVKYANPIALGEPGPREALKARVSPFILRRLKSQVAQDLPPKVEIQVPCELLPAQRRAYDALWTDARARIQRSVKEHGLEGSRFAILDTLLKLRQVCCHPALLGTSETLDLESGKLEAAITLIEELIAGGHRALVFSQFTSMLAILRARLDAMGIQYEYLDGYTRDRQTLVDRFNAGSTPLFLISLKAGGSGLNLTGADYVIHYDPWWNPASEDQATDRAHRIGQTRQVFSYKLVAKDTIEEKLVALQTEKRALVRDLLATDASGKLLTAADVAALFDWRI